jgi:hypothetical protein
MNPAKVARNRLERLEDLPNIGPACARDLRLLGIDTPNDLIGRDPFEMHARLCHLSGQQQDPCMIDVFISIVRFMAGEPPRPWWKFTAERKQLLSTSDKSGDSD